MTIRTLILPLLAAAMCGQLWAAELGEVKVNSHIGQQLSADIELVDLTPADLAEIQARLANPDVFKGAGLEVVPVLGDLHITVAKRDNKRFLHLTTLQAVNADALHIFLELNSGGRQIIRAASLWLTPEPPGQKAAAAQATPAAVPTPPSLAVSPLPHAASPSPALSKEAAQSEAAQRAFAYRREVAMAKAQAAAQGTPAPATAPSIPAAAPAAAIPAPVAHRPVASKPAAAAASSAPAPSCAPEKQVEAQLQQCQAMANKLTDIEGKVQHLEKTLAAPVVQAAVPAAEPVPVKAEAPPVKPGSAPVKPGATPVKPGVAAELAGKSRTSLFAIIGGALAGLAALGGTIYFMRKRQIKGPLKIWQSFRKKGVAEPVEVAQEEPEKVAAQ